MAEAASSHSVDPTRLDVGDEARWLLDLLWSSWPAVTWAGSSQLPDGYRCVERVALLGSGSGRTFSVTLGSRRGGLGCLTAYGRLRPPRRRLERAIVGLGLLPGITQRMHQVVEIGLLDEHESTEVLLSRHFARLFGVRQVVIGCSAGSGPYRKPVLQIFDGRGRPLGYAKVGWNPWTRKAVQREADGLIRMAEQGDDLWPLGVPKLLSKHEWNGLDIVVSSPLPRGVRRVAEGAPLPSTVVLRRIIGPSVRLQRLDTSLWWRDIRQRVAAELPSSATKGRLAEILNLTEEAFGGLELMFGMGHGDLSPWNLAVDGGRTFVWDFESSSPDVPVGFDPLHFGFQAEFVAGGGSVARARCVARDRASRTLALLDVPASTHVALSHLHLLHLAVQHEEARACTGVSDDRFAAEVFDILARDALGAAHDVATPLERRPA